MFAFFKRRWLSINPWKWVGLFLFEFTVVLLGVLVAQQLQERFELRREADRFEVTRSVLDEQARSAGTNLIVRGLQADCIKRNLATVREAVRNNLATDLADLTSHPPHPPVSMSVWSSEVARDARRFLDPERVQQYDFIASNAEMVTLSRQSEEEWWANVLLATDGAQRLSERERSDVALATYKLDHAFEGWSGAVTSFAQLLLLLDLEPDVDLIEAYHQGDGVCAAEVRALLPQLRAGLATARKNLADMQADKKGDAAPSEDEE